LMETRMYRGLRQLIEGWSKNIYLGGRRSFPDEPIQRALVPAMLSIALMFWILPPGVLLATLVDPSLVSLQAPAELAIGLSLVFWMVICGGMGIPPHYGLGYPLGALMGMYIALRSTWRGGRKVEWRGRVYGRDTEKLS
jgi:hypothetical protein